MSIQHMPAFFFLSFCLSRLAPVIFLHADKPNTIPRLKDRESTSQPGPAFQNLVGTSLLLNLLASTYTGLHADVVCFGCIRQ